MRFLLGCEKLIRKLVELSHPYEEESAVAEDLRPVLLLVPVTAFFARSSDRPGCKGCQEAALRGIPYASARRGKGLPFLPSTVSSSPSFHPECGAQ